MAGKNVFVIESVISNSKKIIITMIKKNNNKISNKKKKNADSSRNETSEVFERVIESFIQTNF